MDTNIGRNRLSERIETALMDAIREGEFPPGSKLPSERSLMTMFDVGRPSVKEALLMLERKGFLKLKRGVAPIVTAPTPETLLGSVKDMVTALIAEPRRRTEFYDLRIMLEVCAAQELARSGDAGHLAALREAYARCEDAIGQRLLFRAADLDFHHCLMASTGNALVMALHSALIEWGMYHNAGRRDVAKINARAAKQHLEVLNAIIDEDPARAGEAMRIHLLTRRDAWEEEL